MNKKGHYGGFIVAAAVSFIITKDPLSLSGAWLGSFLPDVDAKKSHINNKIHLMRDIYKPIQKIAFKNSVTYNIFKHRGALTHSWLTVVMLIALYKYYPSSFLFGIIIGVGLHHILDMFTAQGLRYFYPLKLKLF